MTHQERITQYNQRIARIQQTIQASKKRQVEVNLETQKALELVAIIEASRAKQAERIQARINY